MLRSTTQMPYQDSASWSADNAISAVGPNGPRSCITIQGPASHVIATNKHVSAPSTPKSDVPVTQRTSTTTASAKNIRANGCDVHMVAVVVVLWPRARREPFPYRMLLFA